jgi:secreted PhoX family phosphatase
VLALVLTRRAALAAGAGLLAAHEAGAARQPPAAAGPASPLGFVSVPAAGADRVVVPPGYRARVLYAWGDPIGASGLPAGEPAWRGDASEDAAAQALQAGMHHDGMHFFPLPARGADRGLLALNHEYVDHGLLFPDGSAGWSAAKVRKSQAAHGVSVIELGRGPDGAWQVVRPSRHARRITANTPMRLSGPAAQALGGTATGTFANCANGWTPWGTYLTCEENWHGYFGARKRGELPEHDTAFQPDELERRYGIRARGDYIDWHLHDPRFDLHTRPWAASSTRVRPPRTPPTAAWSSTWATTRPASTSTSSSPVPACGPGATRPTAGCWKRGRSTSRASMPRPPAGGAWPPAAGCR